MAKPLRNIARAAIRLAIALLAAVMPGQAASAGDNSSSAGPADPKLLPRVFARTYKMGAWDDYSFPFIYAESPTVFVRLGGESYPMLFDTGTYSCIFWQDGSWAMPPVLKKVAGLPQIAAVDGKSQFVQQGGAIEYAVAPLVNIDGVRVRDAVFRVYSSEISSERHYAGAIAPYMFHDYIIHVSNSGMLISMFRRDEWIPEGRPVVLPLMNLPRGCFVPLNLAGEKYWFHFDTGFSGGIAVVPEVHDRHRDVIELLADDATSFSGWHGSNSYSPAEISRMEIVSYPGLSWASGASIELENIEALLYTDAYTELAGYRVGGIAGSGFWRRFDYAIDYELGRLYLWTLDDE